MNIKQKYRNLSIKNKLFLMILTSIVFLTFIIFIFLVSYEYNETIEEITESTELHAKMVSEYSSTALLFQDIASAEDILDKLSNVKFIVQATLYDTSKIEFTSYIKTGKRELFSLSISEIKDSTYFKNDHIHIIKKVQYKNKLYGYIYLVASAESFYPLILNYALILFLFLVSTILVTFLIGYLLQISISKPLLKLTEYTKNLSENPGIEFDLTTNSTDEIGQLSMSFNNMLTALNQKEIERQRILDSLIESSLKFQAITENINDYLAILNEQGILIYCNPAFKRLGININELIGFSLVNILRSDDIAKFKKILIEINSTNETRNFEFYIKADTNQLIFVEGVFIPMYDVAGVNGILTTFRDVTQRKQSETALRESEEKFRTIINQAVDMIYVVDFNGNFVDVNDCAIKVTGYSLDEFLKMNVLDIDAVQTPDEVNQVIESIEYGKHIAFESSHRKKDGTTFPVEIKIGKVKINQEMFILSYVRDISERKKHELELKKKTDEIDRYFNSSLDLLCIATFEGYFYRLNPGWEVVLGYKMDELENKKYVDFVHPDDVESTIEATKDLANSKVILNFTNRYKCNDGSYKWIEWRAFPIEGKIYAAARDITEKKLDEIEKDRLTKELIEKNKELEQIIFVTSHDLRSPLVNVQGFSTELSITLKQLSEKIGLLNLDNSDIGEIDTIINEQIPHYLGFVTTSITKMENLLKALLRVSRLGRGELNPIKIDMNSLIDKVIDSHKFSINQNNVKISHADLPVISGDEVQINQLFSNLIDNAIKYSRKDKTNNINIYSARENDKILFYVEDTGIGIKKEHLNIIFNMFHRLDPNLTKGEGIGLNIAKKILERHQGSITVESEYNIGSKFIIEFPLN